MISRVSSDRIYMRLHSKWLNAVGPAVIPAAVSPVSNKAAFAGRAAGGSQGN
jgi:hypothetical protein